MNLACKDFLKSIPLLWPTLKYINSNFIKSKYSTNATVFSFNKNIADAKELEITKIDKNETLYMDRFAEVRSYLGRKLNLRLPSHGRAYAEALSYHYAASYCTSASARICSR